MHVGRDRLGSSISADCTRMIAVSTVKMEGGLLLGTSLRLEPLRGARRRQARSNGLRRVVRVVVPVASSSPRIRCRIYAAVADAGRKARGRRASFYHRGH